MQKLLIFNFLIIFREHFGFHYVDFEDPERPRTPKESSRFFQKLATNNGFVEDFR